MRLDKLFTPRGLKLSAGNILQTINCELEMISDDLEFEHTDISSNHPNFTPQLCQLFANGWYNPNNGIWQGEGDDEEMDESYQQLLINLFVEDKSKHKTDEYVAQLMEQLK